MPLEGVTIAGERGGWELRSVDRATAAGGRYVLALAGTPATPADFAGRRLAEPARVVWRMPPFREIAFDLMGDAWRTHVVSMTDVECTTERDAGKAPFIQPKVPDHDGTIMLRFESPFEILAASLEAAIAVWTTGDPFLYDPRAMAALDVSPDGVTWTNLDSREANRGGFGGGPSTSSRSSPVAGRCGCGPDSGPRGVGRGTA
ncbi:MAG: hypothetical protein FJ284_11025 [Planctomycetes bacterium]|nr:hypothetical protein [Planctomycetota bacterium]